MVMTGVDKLQEGTKVNAQIPARLRQPAGRQPPVNSSAKKGGKTQKGS